MKKLLVFFLLCTALCWAIPQYINYQGYLTRTDGSPLDTTVAMTLAIYSQAVGGSPVWTESRPSVLVQDGLFNARLGEIAPLPDAMFNSTQVWLGVTVGNNSEMIPRTQMLSVGYSYRVGTVDGANGGTIGGKINVGMANTNTGNYANVFGQSNAVSGDHAVVGGGMNNQARGGYSFIGGGGGPSVYDSNAAFGYQSVVAGGWANRAAANRGTVGGGAYNTAGVNGGVDATVAGGAFNTASGEGATISGGQGNMATAIDAVVSGGYDNAATGQYSTVGGGQLNKARGEFSVVAGGGATVASDSNCALGPYSFVGGGLHNRAGSDSSVVCGGSHNEAWSAASSVGGGYNNQALASYARIGGGYSNTVGGMNATIAGGYSNHADGTNAAIPGGYLNTATGGFSFAAGYRARANHSSSFVWGASNSGSDSTASFANFTFTARCAGGARFYTAQTGTATGVQLSAGGGSWSSLCDVRQKRLHGDVNTSDVLQKISRLPLHLWSYKSQDERIQHIGPTAQDFYAAFHLGESDTTINTLDPDGVALAAIQELAKENTELRTAVRRYETSNNKLEAEMVELRAAVQTLQAANLKASKEDK